VIIASVPENTYPAGQTELGPHAIPVGLSDVKVTFTCVGWPDLVGLLVARIEISFDGGVTWPEFVQVQWDGPHGKPAVWVRRDLKQPGNPDRFVRAVLTRAAPVTTAITLEAT